MGIFKFQRFYKIKDLLLLAFRKSRIDEFIRFPKIKLGNEDCGFPVVVFQAKEFCKFKSPTI